MHIEKHRRSRHPVDPADFPDRIVSAKVVEAMTGKSYWTLIRWSLDPNIKFPPPLEMGPNSRGWRLLRVTRWIDEQEAKALELQKQATENGEGARAWARPKGQKGKPPKDKPKAKQSTRAGHG